MSQLSSSNERAASAENAPEQPPKSKTNWGLQKVLLGLALGILIGYLFTQRVTDVLPSLLPALMAVFIALFLLILIAVLALPRIINYLAKRYTGQDVDVEAAVGDIQAKANHIADTVAGFALAKVDPQVRENIRQDLPGLLHYLVFSRLRNSGLRMLMTVFVAIGGLMGTILLYNQNQLLQKQNEKIDNQILLDEAARRSSLNFLLGNVLDQVNQELSDPENTKRRLSPQLIGRIASLSQSFQPYYFMEDGKMIERPLSPERGALLLALVNSGIDTLTMDTIFKKTLYKDANLKGAILDSVYLSGADLPRANLSMAVLNGANLKKANLNQADLRKAFLINSNLSEAKLQGTELSDAIFAGANFSKSSLRLADLSRAVLQDANLHNADLFRANLNETHLSRANLSRVDLREAIINKSVLIGANLSGAKGIDLLNLKSCLSIYQLKGLPDSLATLLKGEIEKKPEWLKN